jgi:aspartyl/asparaginyl beta-hydroxylase (cupin superfamily)
LKTPQFPYYNFVHKKNLSSSAKDEFYDPSNFAWTKTIENKYTEISQEIFAFINQHENEFKPYFASELVNEPGKWKTIGFLFWGAKEKKNYPKCPITMNLLKEIPGLVTFGISKLDPHSEIKPHLGDTSAIYRCHLPIKVPASLPVSGFYVGYSERSWEEGKLMIFNDAAYHKGWNHSDESRIILLIDIIRPEFMWQKKWICAFVLSSLALQKYLNFRFKGPGKIFQWILLYPLAALTWLYFSISKQH